MVGLHHAQPSRTLWYFAYFCTAKERRAMHIFHLFSSKPRSAWMDLNVPSLEFLSLVFFSPWCKLVASDPPLFLLQSNKVHLTGHFRFDILSYTGIWGISLKSVVPNRIQTLLWYGRFTWLDAIMTKHHVWCKIHYFLPDDAPHRSRWPSVGSLEEEEYLVFCCHLVESFRTLTYPKKDGS